MKKLNKIVISVSLLAPAVTIPAVLTSCSMNKQGSYAFMFKTTGNHYGELLYQGFSGYMKSAGQSYYDKSPSEANVGEQIQMIETLILQNVQALTISAAGTTGYDNVLERAYNKNIKVVSVDSPISPKYRLVHVDHCDPKATGQWLAYGAILIGMRAVYPYDKLGDIPDMTEFKQHVADLCAQWKGSKIRFGFLSSTVDSPSQNEWIKYTSEYLKDPAFERVVDSSNFEIKYGNDEPTASKQQATAFINQGTIDVMICPTTVGMLAAGQAVKQSGTEKVKITGIGLPSEMHGYMPKTKDEDAFQYACPYMMTWNVKMFGEVAAFVTQQATKKENPYLGKVGEVLEYDGTDGVHYHLETIATGEKDPSGKEYVKVDGSKPTKIISLKPIGICGANIDKYIDI